MLIDCGDQDSWADGAEPEVRRSRMGEQRCRLRLVGHSHIAAGWANPNAPVAPRYIADQGAKGWRERRRGVPLQPKPYVGCRPAKIEGAAQRGCAEPVDTTNTSGLLIGQHPKLGGNRVLERPCSDSCEIGLDDEMGHWSWKQLSQVTGHWLIGPQWNSGERGHRTKCNKPQPGRLMPGQLHELPGRQRSVPQPWP